MNNLLASLVILLFGIWIISAHPVQTFNLVFTDSEGRIGQEANITAGINTTIYFSLQDQFNNLSLVRLGDLMQMHQRYIHLLVVSLDFAHALHTHPDFFSNLAYAPNDTTVFKFVTPFPISGEFTIAASFLFMDTRLNIIREGFSDFQFTVYGTPLPNFNRVFNYTISNRFSTYPIASNDEFDVWVFIDSNINSESGFYGELIVGQGTADANSTVMYAGLGNFNSTINYCGQNCTWFYLTIYSNESSTTTASMIPYLAAPVHITIAAEDGAVYHAHGTYVPPGMNFPDIMHEIGQTSMTEIMTLNPATDPLYNLSMNAAMIGITFDGTIDCLTDEGTVMMEMGGMMDMNTFYGPSTFGTVAGIFNWPDGGGFYNMYAYMKLRLPNGEERLIVPQFTIQVQPTIDDPPYVPFNGTFGEDSGSSTVFGFASALLALSTLVLL